MRKQLTTGVALSKTEGIPQIEEIWNIEKDSDGKILFSSMGETEVCERTKKACVNNNQLWSFKNTICFHSSAESKSYGYKYLSNSSSKYS